MATYYESDITKLIQQLLLQNPKIIEEQKKGRSMWWDKKPDPDASQRAKESKVSQQAYVYQNKL